MKKKTLLILAYAITVAVLIVSVKLVQAHLSSSQTSHETFVADCGDPPPTVSAGE